MQLSIHLTMILLSQTNYPLENGLQSLFQESTGTTTTWWYFSGLQDAFQALEEKYNTTKWFLVFSIVWSFKTCAMTSIKIKSETKMILPIFPTILLLFRYLFVFLIRVSCICSYFAPYIGLMDIMDHYQAETIPLDFETWCRINGTDDQKFHYWNAITDQFQSVSVSDLFRSNYANCSEPSNPGLPSIKLYTVINLGTALAFFGIFYLLYAIGITIIKHYVNPAFQSSSFGRRLQHILETLNRCRICGSFFLLLFYLVLKSSTF